MAKRSLFILPIVLSGLAPIASCKVAASKPVQPQNVNQTAAVKSLIVEPSIAAAQPPVVSKPLSPEQTVKINALVKRLMTCSEREFDAISDELNKLGESAIPFIVPLLKHPSEAVRTCGAAQLITAKKSSKLVIQLIVPLLKDPDAKIRANVLESLIFISEAAKSTIPSLIPLLKDPDAKIRTSTVKLLSHWAVLEGFAESDIRSLKPAMPSLILLLKDSNAEVRTDTAQIIGGMGESAKSAIPSLIPLLKDPNADVREYAVAALGNMGESAKSATPSILQLFDNERDAIVRWRTIKSLENLGYKPTLGKDGKLNVN
jgi:HEAT repeat protein